MKQICTIGISKKTYFKDLEIYCSKKGYELSFLKYKDISTYTDEKDGLFMEHRLNDLLSYDVYFLFNSSNPFLYQNAVNLKKFLHQKGKKVIHNILNSSNYISTIRKLENAGVKHSEYVSTFGLKAAKDALIELSHPAKIVINSHYTEYSEDWTESTDLIRSKLPVENVILQPDLPEYKHYLVYFLSDEIISIIEKTISYRKKKRYIKLEKAVDNKKISEEITNMALKISKITKLNFGRYEVLDKDGNLLLKNIKPFPKYKSLEKQIGLNFALKVYTNLVN